MDRLKDKVALVTGGASGLGKAMALRFAKEGATVIVADIDKEGGQEVAEMHEAIHFTSMDVCDADSVTAAFDSVRLEFDHLDVLVNNAGVVSEQKPIIEETEENWKRTLGVNLDGAFRVLHHGLKMMVNNAEGGSVINMASVCGMIATPNISPYTASKGALISLTRSAASEYADNKIRVNALAPTAVLTDMVRTFIAQAPDPEEAKVALENYTPMPGIPEPDDVASAALFLASDEARYISGITLPVDGGYIAQ